jgi:hypothetical protein
MPTNIIMPTNHAWESEHPERNWGHWNLISQQVEKISQSELKTQIRKPVARQKWLLNS